MPRLVSNPPNPWASREVEWLDEPPEVRLEIFEEEAKSILSENKSPDLGFRFSVNPYRGCIHACAYCYARPSHQYLGFGAGTDFDRKIVVKTNAPELLAKELRTARAKDEVIVFSGNTDCYQGLEASYRLTRRCLEVARDAGAPVSVITKGALVARDADVLEEISKGAGATVFVSIPILDDEVARAIEPWASRPIRRLEALELLSKRGIRTGVSVSPLIPGLNDHAVSDVLRRAREAGASLAFLTLLRLPTEVEPVFVERIQRELPLKAEKILRGIEDMRPDPRRQSQFGARMRGEGARWDAVRKLFELERTRLGYTVSTVGDASRIRRGLGTEVLGGEASKAPPEPKKVPPNRQLKLF